MTTCKDWLACMMLFIPLAQTLKMSFIARFPRCFFFQSSSYLVNKCAGHRLGNPCSKHCLPVWGLAHPTLTNSVLLDVARNVQCIGLADQTDHDKSTNLMDRPNPATNLKHCTHVDFVHSLPWTTSSVKGCRYGQSTKLAKSSQVSYRDE